MRQILTLLSFALAATVAVAQAPAPAKPPPIEAFFDNGSVQQMRLSPNQRWLASQVAGEGQKPTRLVIADMQGKEPTIAVAAFATAGVQWFRWVSDDLLIASVANPLEVSTESSWDALVSITRDGKTSRVLIKNKWENPTPPSGGVEPLEGNFSFAALGTPGTEEIIISAGKYDSVQQLSTRTLLTMNARTGARRSLLDNYPPDTRSFMFDPQGRPRLARAFRAGISTYYWRDPDQTDWRQIARFELFKGTFEPAFIDGSGRLYVTLDVSGGKGDELRRFDFATGRPEEQALVSTPGFDSGFTPIMDRKDGELLGLRTTLEADTTIWLKPSIADVQKRVDETLRGRVNQLLCTHCDEQDLILVFSQSDRAPGDFVLMQPRTGAMQPLGQRRPGIDPSAMAPVHFERIQARDGHDLPVYVTLPGGAAVKSKPAVVLVHGGPNARGRDWSWESDSQFLASRGYVVIEPEFRGSAGFGLAHERDGFRQWGQKMQDDVSDALAWAVKKGWVDASRVCIAGASYGGYATLVGLAKTPDTYRCGVAWVGVSDLKLMYSAFWSDISRAAKQHSMKETLGDPDKDKATLEANSPVNMADRMKAPLLLAYGKVDRRVPIEHGEAMRDALRKAGREPEWVVYPNESHGWVFPDTKKDFWQRVETFLAKHIGR